MNKESFVGKPFKSALLCLLVVLTGTLGSCRKETADTGDLLATVPSSSGFVAGINLKSLLEKTGCKVDGSDITVGESLSAWVESKNSNGEGRNAFKLFLAGESGVDPSVAIFFTDAYNMYLTATLADTEKFETFVSSQSGEQFVDSENGVRTCGNVAVKGAQAWICVSSHNTIDSKAIANYATLGESQSFLKNEYSSGIVTMTSDVVGCGDIKALSRFGILSGQYSTALMMLTASFEDVSLLSFNVDFQKGKALASIGLLNGKGKSAKCLLPMSKVDLNTIKSIGGDAEIVFAFSLTKDFMKKLEKIGGSFIGQFMEDLKCVDGTVAGAVGVANKSERSMDIEAALDVVVTTDGNPSKDFMDLLSRFGKTKKDGKFVRLSSGEVNGGLNVENASEFMKGSYGGVVADFNKFASDSVIKTVAVVMVPEDGGIKYDVTVESSDPSENILLSMIKSDTK